ncbi:MAG: VanZ family protein [Clostridia bacterium]|nr:VanZ family protein [Clostridia bacterium]
MKHPFAKGGILRRADTWILSSALALLILFFVGEILYGIRQYPVSKATPLVRTALLSVICAIFYLGSRLRARHTDGDRLTHRLFVLFFFLYLYLLLTVTLTDKALGRVLDLSAPTAEQRAYYLEHFVNFRPFHSIYQVYIRGFFKGYIHGYYVLLNLLGNLCAFMPLSFFLPLLFKSQRRWYVLIPTVALSVIAIEALQFWLMVGSCDVDDLILNTLGAWLTYALLKIPPLRRRLPSLETMTD